jgi:hypothetical protein
MALLDGDVPVLDVSQLSQSLSKGRDPALVAFLPL